MTSPFSRSFLPSLLFLCLSGCVTPSSIDSYLTKQHQQGKLNGSVMVVKDGQTFYKNSFGFASGSKEQSLNPDYHFGIGSIEKEFTGVAIMQLNEQHLLSLNDTLSSFIDNLPGWAEAITIKHLLQYSSGLPMVNWEPHFERGSVQIDSVLQSAKSIEQLAFTPGTDYIYSNYNIFFLKKVVEQVSGLTFNEYVKERLLTPYDLEGILIQEKFPFEDNTLMAIPFNQEFQDDDLEYNLSLICASVDGMYQWFDKLDNFKIISRESVLQLSQEAIRGDNIQAPIGRGDWENGELQLHLHHGSSHNYEALVRHHKKDGIMIIFLTNQKHGNLHDMADGIYSIVQKNSQ